MNRKVAIIVFSFCVSIVYFGCIPAKKYTEAFRFNNKCQCDSILIESNQFLIDNDSSLYSIFKKAPFDYSLFIDTGFVTINNRKFYYLMAGLDIDTIGLLNISNDKYLYKRNPNEADVLLFDFNSKIGNSWMINREGFFKSYNIVLNEIKYNSYIGDSVYCFTLDYKGPKFSNGYYFVRFEVSKYYGITSFSFDNGIDCLYSLPQKMSGVQTRSHLMVSDIRVR